MQTVAQVPLDILVRQLQQIPGIQVTLTDTSKCVTFGEWAMRWLNTYKRGVVKDNTFWGTYYEPVVLHLIPYFGEWPINSIKPSDVQDYFKSLRKKFALETQKKIRNALRMICDAGIDENICYTNPVRKTLTLISDVPPLQKHTWTLDEYKVAYQYALAHPAGLDVITLMETALTRSELLGLTWANFDAKKGILTLENGLVAQKSTETERRELIHDGLKNKHRYRTIPLSPLLAGLLSLKPHTVTVGKSKVKTEYIFHAPNGGPYDPANWYRRVLCKFMADLTTAYPEIPLLTTHELRHTRATLLKDNGTDLFSIARLLGHCDLNMLAKRYAHDNVEALRQALGLQE